ncbi:MAG: serine--tRNA ligase [Candidatus Brocadiia bacterium]
MLDIELLRKETARITDLLRRKNFTGSMDELLAMDSRRREAITAFEGKRAEQKKLSKEIGAMMARKQSPGELKAVADKIAAEIKDLEAMAEILKSELAKALLFIPNIPDDDVPISPDESGNRVLAVWGVQRAFDFEPKTHWDLGAASGMLDLTLGATLAGSGFYVLKGDLAKLERSLIDFMIGLHTSKHGYTEIATPFLAREEVMVGTGQLPKFAEDMYKIEGEPLYLIPTAEVTLANSFRETILREDELPKYVCGYTPCFRKEAGASGRDTRGMIRVHQFSKVELIKVVHPERSSDELEKLVDEACDVLRQLGIPHRRVLLSTGDMSFSSAKTVDLEVWCPGVGKWLEVSSCSNCRDYQARRMQTRFRQADGKGNKFVHILNGSGVALPRLMIAIIENYQEPDGRIRLPEAMLKYFDGRTHIGGAER